MTSQNQHPQTVIELADQIRYVRECLEEGRLPSDLAQQLFEQGLPVIKMMVVFREATGVGIGDMKRLAQWWSPAVGVTDPQQFNHHASAALVRLKARGFGQDDAE